MKLLASTIISFFTIVIMVDNLIAVVVTATSTKDNNNINMIQHQYNNSEDNISNN
tara:strand:- start:149 stop:313 length:165 start_codon:yes stop_codon:yes gene_type:complete